MRTKNNCYELPPLTTSYFKYSIFSAFSKDTLTVPNVEAILYTGKELPFIPVNEDAVPFLVKRDLKRAFETMMKDSFAEEKAMIQIEKIKGFILLLSANNDEIILAVKMGEKMRSRLENNHLKYPFKHVILKVYMSNQQSILKVFLLS